MIMRVLIPLCLLSLLTACGTERVITKPVVVETTKIERVLVPADLLVQHQKTTIPEALTYGEAIELWSLDRASIEKQNGQLKAIESLNEEH